METPVESIEAVKEVIAVSFGDVQFLKNEENVITIANALLSSKGPTKYDVAEIKYSEDRMNESGF